MKNIEGLFGVLGAVFGIFTYFIGDLETLSSDQKNGVFVICLVVFLIILISIHSSGKKKMAKVRYAEAIPGISRAISKFINNFKVRKFIVSSEDLADDFSRIYTEIKNAKCCITIKIFFEENNIKKVKTIRANSFKGRKNREKEEQTEKTFNEIFRLNTDLEDVIFYGKEKSVRNNYFFSNNLISRDGYKNTRISKEYYDKRNEENPLLKWIKKENEWPLPYKSTIVVPLMSVNVAGEYSGILCIDSDKKGVFDKKIDVSILQTIAETLHLAFKSEIKNKSTKGTG